METRPTARTRRVSRSRFGVEIIRMSFRRFIVACLGLIAVLAAASAAWQAIASARETRAMPEPGRSIDIGGRRIQIYCTGRGSPVVVLEAGLGGLLNFRKHTVSRHRQYGAAEPA